MSHTPGDWQWGTSSWTHVRTVDAPSERFPGSREEIAQALGATSERAEANARLIAAAPELLEACKAVRALRRRGIATAPIRETNLLVDRAIAKAEGREP